MDEYQLNRFISVLKSYFKKSYGYSLSYFSDWLYESLEYNEPDVAALFDDQAELAAAVLELDDLYDVYFSEFGFYSKTYIITVKGRSKINMYKDLNIEDDDISYTEFATGIHKVDTDGELKENLILHFKRCYMFGTIMVKYYFVEWRIVINNEYVKVSFSIKKSKSVREKCLK